MFMTRLTLIASLILLTAAVAPGQTPQVSPNVIAPAGVIQSNASVRVFGLAGQPAVLPVAGPTTVRVPIGFIPQVRALQLNPQGVPDPGEPESVPTEFALGQNYPNPFNPATTIPFSLDAKGPAKLEIFNLLGQRIRLFDLAAYGPGSYELHWMGRTDEGYPAPSGILFYRLTSEDRQALGRMLLIK